MHFYLTSVKVVESFEDYDDNQQHNLITHNEVINEHCNGVDNTSNINNGIGKDDNIDIKIDNDDIKIDNDENKDMDKHYISVVYIKPVRRLDVTQSNSSKNKIPISLYKIIVKRYLELPTFEIDFSYDFKYKKYIREQSLALFSFNKKDITTIKHINTYHNFHNYAVILSETRSNHNIPPCETVPVSKDIFTWKTIFQLNICENSKHCHHFNTYCYKIEFRDTLSRKIQNRVSFGDIYSIVKQIC